MYTTPDDTYDAFVALNRELSPHHVLTDRSYAPSIRLVAQGFHIERVFLITGGVVKLSFINNDGREFIVSLRSAPFILGAAGAMLAARSLVTATTVTHCTGRQLSAADFRTFAKGNSDLAYHVGRALARECRNHTIEVMETRSRHTRHRLIKLLRDLDMDAFDTNSPADYAGLLKKNEIAKLLAITPEHLSRLLRAMQREGLVRRDKRRIIIQNTTSAQELLSII